MAPESSATSAGAPSPMPGDPRNEIKRLFDEVEKQRNDLHMINGCRRVPSSVRVDADR